MLWFKNIAFMPPACFYTYATKTCHQNPFYSFWKKRNFANYEQYCSQKNLLTWIYIALYHFSFWKLLTVGYLVTLSWHKKSCEQKMLFQMEMRFRGALLSSRHPCLSARQKIYTCTFLLSAPHRMQHNKKRDALWNALGVGRQMGSKSSNSLFSLFCEKKVTR